MDKLYAEKTSELLRNVYQQSQINIYTVFDDAGEQRKSIPPREQHYPNIYIKSWIDLNNSRINPLPSDKYNYSLFLLGDSFFRTRDESKSIKSLEQWLDKAVKKALIDKDDFKGILSRVLRRPKSIYSIPAGIQDSSGIEGWAPKYINLVPTELLTLQNELIRSKYLQLINESDQTETESPLILGMPHMYNINNLNDLAYVIGMEGTDEMRLPPVF